MFDVPLDLQRRFEQRWAARFVRALASATPESIDLKSATDRSPGPTKKMEKPADST
jgi:hypothetical protein